MQAEPKHDWAECLNAISQNRDRAAFARLFRHFAPRVKSYLMKNGGSAPMAEEAMQEAMTTVWQKAHMFDSAKASAATWIFTIARNKQLDAFRKQNRPEPEDLPWNMSDSPDPAAEVAVQQEQDQLRRAIETLPAAQRTMIERAFYGELSHSEIATADALPLGTVKSRIRLALDRLRHEMTAR